MKIFSFNTINNITQPRALQIYINCAYGFIGKSAVTKYHQVLSKVLYPSLITSLFIGCWFLVPYGGEEGVNHLSAVCESKLGCGYCYDCTCLVELQEVKVNTIGSIFLPFPLILQEPPYLVRSLSVLEVDWDYFAFFSY